MMTDEALPQGLRVVGEDEGLPALPESRYLMLKAREPRQPVTDLLLAQVHDVFGSAADLDAVEPN
jgi:hypothetical protein